MTEREQEVRNTLQSIAIDVENKLPKGMGFTLLAYEFGNENPERKMLYVSNSDRESVLKAMLEFLQKNLDNPKMFGKDI